MPRSQFLPVFLIDHKCFSDIGLKFSSFDYLAWRKDDLASPHPLAEQRESRSHRRGETILLDTKRPPGIEAAVYRC